jgi:CRISPR-associated protein Cas2
MPRRKRIAPKSLPERNRSWAKTGLPSLPAAEVGSNEASALPELLGQWFAWLHQQPPKRPEDMYCFIYYDIENNKIRRLVAKLLEKEGCIRVQKSVFFARVHRRRYRDLTELLRQIQQLYENNDSIILLPVGEDMLNSLQCIGQSFNLELITAPKNTIFV